MVYGFNDREVAAGLKKIYEDQRGIGSSGASLPQSFGVDLSGFEFTNKTGKVIPPYGLIFFDGFSDSTRYPSLNAYTWSQINDRFDPDLKDDRDYKTQWAFNDGASVAPNQTGMCQSVGDLIIATTSSGEEALSGHLWYPSPTDFELNKEAPEETEVAPPKFVVCGKSGTVQLGQNNQQAMIVRGRGGGDGVLVAVGKSLETVYDWGVYGIQSVRLEIEECVNDTSWEGKQVVAAGGGPYPIPEDRRCSMIFIDGGLKPYSTKVYNWMIVNWGSNELPFPADTNPPSSGGTGGVG